MELRILRLLLLGILQLLHALALAADSDSLWKPLESLQELDRQEFTLCLASVPWCGESRSFMRDFVDLVKRENVQLQLRYVNVHRDKTLLGSQKSLTLFRFREAFNYTGKLSAGHVLASVKHVLSASPSDFPFQRLHSVADLHEFVGTTDRSLVVLDLCGWTVRRDRMVEDYENDEVGLAASSQLKWLYGNANNSSDLCTPSADRDFDVFFHNLSEFANANALTPYSRRFGIITSPQVLRDANIEVPTSKPCFLMAQSQDIAPSWRILTDAGQLQVFLADSTVLVDEVNRDTELPNDRPSVLLFINRGSHLSEVRAESMRVLQVVRDVARYYANRNLLNDGQDNDSAVSADKEESLPAFSENFSGNGKNGQILAIREKELSQGLTGLLSNPTEAILQLLLQHGNKKRNEDDSQQDNEDRILVGTSTTDSLETPTFPVNYQAISPNELDVSRGSEQPQEDSTSFNFAFFEGADAVQELFTGAGKGKPSVVMVFPERNSYYTYMESTMTFTSLVNFLDEALSGTVQPTLRSGPMPVTPRQPIRPPFVNLDFHQVHSVPQVTAETFSEFVLGNRSLISMDNSESSLGGVWNKNSLVVFTLPWCGFCKRMELAVYEVHRYYTGYYSPRNWSLTNFSEFKAAGFEALDIYQMDCSINECSHILKNIFEEERFPSVVLFPARQKTTPVVYGGAPSVKDVLHFIANFGTSTSFRVFEGLQKTQPSSIRIEEHESLEAESLRKVRLLDQASEELQVITPLRIGVGQVLLASDKLSNTSVLERAAILIISVTMDHIMGVVVNKRMQWEQLTSLDDHVRESLQDAFLGYGGPVYEHPKHLFALTRLEGIDDFWKISSSLYIGGPSATEKVMEQIEAHKMQASDFTFVLGHCGWSLLQLQQELAAGYWLVTQYREDLFPWSFSAPASRHGSPSQ